MQIEIERVKMENTKLVSKDLILIGALNAVMFMPYFSCSKCRNSSREETAEAKH